MGDQTPRRRKATSRFESATGRARKVSVSLPEDLVAAVQERLAPGEFSQYVADAVARQLEADRLRDLIDDLDAEFGPVPAEAVEEARRAWPDVE